MILNKMRKMIVVLAVTFFITTVMTGLTAASPAEINILPEGTINLVPGEYVETTAHLYNMFCDGSPRTLHVTVPGGTASELTFYVTDLTGSGTAGPTQGGITYTYTPTAQTTEYDIKVEIKTAPGTEGHEYTVKYEDIDSGTWDVGSCTVPMSAIPEFATIAIPVAAILGLLFFFNHRKRRKE